MRFGPGMNTIEIGSDWTMVSSASHVTLYYEKSY